MIGKSVTEPSVAFTFHMLMGPLLNSIPILIVVGHILYPFWLHNARCDSRMKRDEMIFFSLQCNLTPIFLFLLLVRLIPVVGAGYVVENKHTSLNGPFNLSSLQNNGFCTQYFSPFLSPSIQNCSCFLFARIESKEYNKSLKYLPRQSLIHLKEVRLDFADGARHWKAMNEIESFRWLWWVYSPLVNAIDEQRMSAARYTISRGIFQQITDCWTSTPLKMVLQLIIG